jgi:hypothetical protein
MMTGLRREILRQRLSFVILSEHHLLAISVDVIFGS